MMAPTKSRKRSRTPEEDKPSTIPKKRLKHSKGATQTLFDVVDTPPANGKHVNSRKALEELAGDDDGSSSDSEADSDDFEDIEVTNITASTTANSQNGHDEDDEDDEDMNWESAVPNDNTENNEHDEIGDISVALNEDGSYVEPLVSAATGKKGPLKRERQIRMLTHCLHVQTLMWHNTVRNSWLNDATVQKTLVDALPTGVQADILQWKKSMGKLSAEELNREKERALAEQKLRAKKKGRKSVVNGQKSRDWSYNAEHTEAGNVDLSHGDPMLRLLKMLATYWRKRFTITAPGLRKTGYMDLRGLRSKMKDWDKDRDAEEHGEVVKDLPAFRQLAKDCEGSRDVGAQLFVALLRGIGLEVRMVASLQPSGFGFSKGEDAIAKPKATENAESSKSKPAKPAKKLPAPKLREALTPRQGKRIAKEEEPSRQSTRGNKTEPINLDDTDSELSDPPSDTEQKAIRIDSDDESVMDVTPASKKRPTKKYDRDLAFPIYWAEVLSPASNKWIPVDPLVMSTIANNDDLLQSFEPRGAKADKGKQVICYVIGHMADGTAKDVTVRYLKRHQLPGKTKGIRMPIEKVPIYNKRGKVKKYEEYDWFQELMLRYRKLDKDRTEADDLEEDTVLKPYQAAKVEKVIEKESLAWYKASAEFVLEDHLRREEALLPEAESVKTFTAGKGDKAKEYQVFLRKDVVQCKTVESWHKEGRGLLPGAQPLKWVPIRAVTLQRKREIEDAQRETGEKPEQGLYSEAQTDWIIPPPIKNGVIPRNAFNNMDVFVPTMVPKGATHLPMRGTAKVCKRLEIDYAEACTGFEFGNKRAVPIITGVVVANENAARVMKEWKKDQEEIKRKEDVKRTAAAMSWWRKMLIGLRVLDRMKADYANSSKEVDAVNPFVKKAAPKPATKRKHDSMLGGGFIVDDDDHGDHAADSGELVTEHADDLGGGFMVDDMDDEATSKAETPMAPISLQSMHEATTPTSLKKATPAKGINKRKSGATAAEKPSSRKRVVVELDQSNEESKPVAKAVKNNTSNGNKARVVKTTPKKSPYFSSQDVISSDEADDDDEDLEDDAEPAPEVVSVRRTTARTRGKA